MDPHYLEAERLLGVRELGWDEVSRIGGNFMRMFKDAGLSCNRGAFNVARGAATAASARPDSGLRTRR